MPQRSRSPVAWYGLATATGLIYHFLPAAPPVAAAWTLRSANHGPIGRRSSALVLAVGLAAASAITLDLALQGRSLDDASFTAVTLLAGLAVGTWLPTAA